MSHRESEKGQACKHTLPAHEQACKHTLPTHEHARKHKYIVRKSEMLDTCNLSSIPKIDKHMEII